uniref:CCHC-type domain-containing protein n=1 Tax=Gadus morhua TaxID=8049 RepID=A0A8C5BKX5_GADMO
MMGLELEKLTKLLDCPSAASQGESIEKGSEVGAVMVDGKLTEQQLGLQQAEERLYRDYIHRLVKQSPEYPNFQYLCKLCSVHIENIQGAHKHIKEKRHKKNIMEKQEENELRALPPPSEAQLWAVDAAVLEAARVQGISEEDFQQRQAVVSRMEETIQQHLTAQFLEVESDFHAKVPVVFCRDTSSGLACKVSAGNDLACLTTNHLATLARLEPRLVPLVLAFRYWAQVWPTLTQLHFFGQSLGQLWLELLRFYTLEFALEDYIISIRLKELLTREQKNWPRRRLAIEDPFAVKRNVARSLNSQMVFEYIQERFRTAYKYFACPQSLSTRGRQRGGKQAGRRPGTGGAQKPREEEAGKDGQRRMNEGDLLEGRLQDLGLSDGESPDKKRLSLAANGVLDSDSEEEEDDEEEMEEEEENRVSQKNRLVLPEDLHYIFDRMIFTGGKPPTVVCSICKRDGHLKDECPEDFKKMELKPLPPMGDHFREILDGLCRLCYHELSPSLIDQQKREQILVGLERFIRKEYNDKALLCLFGSSKNGFGFRDSDLDICMTLEGHDTAERLNCKEIIEGLAKVLKKHTGLKNILPITTAKVPIVKFEHRQSLLEGDISLYNTLRCDIGDASRGSLSSYAYILMVLYFLQQRQPPVIPVLQEIFDGSNVPECMVDGWNAFFFNDIEDLRRRLPELQQNKESVGELWLGLLRFYTEEFDFKEHVISIRQRKRLTTFEKQWTSKCIAIEDPFDLNHNLGAGVSRKMTNFIMKAFINGRKLFGTPFYPLSGTEADYFFDSKVLTDGELAPNDRCCRICGKIGHYMKDCPKRRRVKKKEGEKEEDVKEDEREPRERRCFQCGDMGHVRRDCPDYRHLRQRAPGGPAAHMVRNMVSSHSIPIPQSDRTARTRQSSECSDSRQTPPYSPQPTPFSQSPSPFSQSPAQPAGSPQTAQCKSNAGGPAKVPLPLFNFPAAHPAHGNPKGIIFAQPAGRPLGLGGAGRDAHWQNHLAQPGALVGNGTVGSRSWEPSAGPHFSMSPSWPYRMPHGFLQQGNGAYQHSKAFQGPGEPCHHTTTDPIPTALQAGCGAGLSVRRGTLPS